MEQWSGRMFHRLAIFALEEEDKALFHYSRAESFTIAYFISQALLLLFPASGAAVYWPWLSLSFTFAYFSSLLRPIASFHRIHDRLDLLAQFQHTRARRFGTDFRPIGLRHPQIQTPSELRFKKVKRRIKTGGFVLLVAVFAVVACRWLPQKMTNRLSDFKLREEDKALLHHSRAEHFIAVYLLSQSLVFFFAAVYWPWLSLSSLRIYGLLAQFQHTRGFRIDFLGLLNPQIPTPSVLRFKMMVRRLKTGVFVLLMSVFAAVKSLARRWLPQTARSGMGEGMICYHSE